MSADFHQPRDIIIGQARQQTASANFTSDGTAYRRATGGGFHGIRLDVTAHDPTTASERWIIVDLTQPRAEDGPARPVDARQAGLGPIAGDPGDPGHGVPMSGRRQYQVTWVQSNGNETAPSPPSVPVTTTNGRVEVPLPVWVDPQDPTPTGQLRVPEIPTGRRVYRTVTSSTGAAGEAFLVKAIDNATATVFTDDRGDDQLGEVLLSKMTVRYRHTVDRDGAQLAKGFAALHGTLVQAAYQETLAGDPLYRGTLYEVDLAATPPAADVTYTTRPAATPPSGKAPRVTWRSKTATEPAGIGTARAMVFPLATPPTGEQSIRAFLQGVPAEFAVDWATRGETRTRVEFGNVAKPALPLAGGVGTVVLRAAAVDAPLQTESARTISIDSDPDRLGVTARGLRRLRLMLGLPHPDVLSYAAFDDGVNAELELDPRTDGRPRSLRVLRDAIGKDGKKSRLMIRAGELPDVVKVDARPGDDTTPLKAAVSGRLRRVMVLSQTGDELATEDVTQERRRDGTWATVPDLSDHFDLEIGKGHLAARAAGPIRADASVRSAAGQGTEEPKTRQIQASVAATSADALFPEGGQTVVSLPEGASGRVATSTRGLAPLQRDRLLAVRATPQVDAVLREAAGENLADDLAARFLGLTGVVLPRSGSDDPYRASFTSKRANHAFRGHAWLTDLRVQPQPWDLVKARAVDLPETIVATLEKIGRYTLTLNRRSGRFVVFAQPQIIPKSGVMANKLVGVGLATIDVDALPKSIQVDALGGANDFQSVPFNKSPDANWRRSGFRIKSDGEVIARAIQIFDAGYVRPTAIGDDDDPSKLNAVPPTAFWTQAAAAIVKVASENAMAPGAVWIWTPAEPLPSSLEASDWEDLDSWLGFKIEAPALVTLQLQSYQAQSQAIPRWWHGLSWLLRAEFQMKDYRGEVTVHGEITPTEYLVTGDEDAGPGQWVLRIPDGGPAGGQVCFGNTGGWISSRPRIFAPFTPTYG